MQLRWTMAAAAGLVGAVLVTPVVRAFPPPVALPLLVKAKVCAGPDTLCPKPDAELDVVINGVERKIGISDLTVLQGTVTSGTVLSDLEVPPVYMYGRDEELAKLTPGRKLRMRAVVRIGAHYIFVDSLTDALDSVEQE
jgi:hypothetical protein